MDEAGKDEPRGVAAVPGAVRTAVVEDAKSRVKEAAGEAVKSWILRLLFPAVLLSGAIGSITGAVVARQSGGGGDRDQLFRELREDIRQEVRDQLAAAPPPQPVIVQPMAGAPTPAAAPRRRSTPASAPAYTPPPEPPKRAKPSFCSASNYGCPDHCNDQQVTCQHVCKDGDLDCHVDCGHQRDACNENVRTCADGRRPMCSD